MMRLGLRSVVFLLTSTLVGGGLALVGCSDAAAPAESGGGGGASGPRDGGIITSDGAVGAGADADADGGFDAGPPPHPCVSNDSLSGDAGALPTSCPGIASCSAFCGRIATRFKTGVAQTAIACLKDLGTCSDMIQASNCVDRAVGAACADTTGAAYCAPLVTACDPNAGGPGSNISESDCESLADALTTAGRNEYQSCLQTQISGGDCPDTVLTCTRQMRE